MQRTTIEYLTHTWNPIAMRCTPISPGCAHCWHLTMAKRLVGNPKTCNEFKNAYGGAIPPVLIHTELQAPLHLKKPAWIGVQFMGDLFHETIPKGFLDAIWSTMAEARQHTFLMLTKRPERMLEFMSDRKRKGWKVDWMNIWLGVTVCNKEEADEKIPILLQIPAVHRWVSVEPMLGPIDLRHIKPWHPFHGSDGADALCGGSWGHPHVRAMAGQNSPGYCNHSDAPTLDWIVCGGLSLPGGKVQPPKKEWVDSLISQCDAAGVPLFIKLNAQYPEERKKLPK